MPIVLYAKPISNYCAKVEIALRLKSVPFERREPPDGYGSPAYRAIVPAGTIPGLVDGDLVLAESEVINEYLDEAYPEPPLLPDDPKDRARVRLMARFHDGRIEPPLRALFAQMDPRRRDEAALTAKLGEYAGRLAELARMTSPDPWLAGSQPTLADCAYPGTFLMAERMHAALGRPHALPEPIAAWLAHASAHPAIAPVLAAQRAATDDWLRSKGAI